MHVFKVEDLLYRGKEHDMTTFKTGAEIAYDGDRRDAAIGRAFAAGDMLDTMRAQHQRRETTLANMERYGGSFVKTLALAARRADDATYTRLSAAFPELWEKYSNEF